MKLTPGLKSALALASPPKTRLAMRRSSPRWPRKQHFCWVGLILWRQRLKRPNQKGPTYGKPGPEGRRASARRRIASKVAAKCLGTSLLDAPVSLVPVRGHAPKTNTKPFMGRTSPARRAAMHPNAGGGRPMPWSAEPVQDHIHTGYDTMRRLRKSEKGPKKVICKAYRAGGGSPKLTSIRRGNRRGSRGRLKCNIHEISH